MVSAELILRSITIALLEMESDIVVFCPTKEDASTLMFYLHLLNIPWLSGESALSKSKWIFFKEQTCYRIQMNHTKKKACFACGSIVNAMSSTKKQIIVSSDALLYNPNLFGHETS